MRRISEATYQRERAERAARAERYFANHVATIVVQTEDVTVLRWEKPGAWHAAMTYTLRGGYLIVTGDLYDAIYASGVRTLESWAGCDLGYFASKCVASPYGRGYRGWDDDRAWRRVRHSLASRAEYGPEVRRRWRELTAWSWPLHSESDWIEFLREHGRELFGDDWYEDAAVGTDISWECAMHLEGLKRAVGQLRSSARQQEVA